MARRRQAQAVTLSKAERKSLQALTRRSTAQQRQVMRSHIALVAHRGESTASIAQALGVSVQTVSHWRTRLVQHGVQGLQDAPRPGRPRRVSEEPRLELLALACKPAEPGGRATPTLDELVERAIERGVTAQISRSHLQRILQTGDLRPHRVKRSTPATISGLSFTSRHCTPVGSIRSSCCSASTRAVSCATPAMSLSNTCASAPKPLSRNAIAHPSLSNGHSLALSCKLASP